MLWGHEVASGFSLLMILHLPETFPHTQLLLLRVPEINQIKRHSYVMGRVVSGTAANISQILAAHPKYRSKCFLCFYSNPHRNSAGRGAGEAGGREVGRTESKQPAGTFPQEP